MKAREYFRRVRIAEREIKIISAKLSHYEELGFSSGGIVSGTGNARKGTSRVELAACGAVDALRDLQRQKREFLAIIAQAEGVIKKIPQERYRMILEYHYLIGKSLSWISDEMDYKDRNSIYRAHGWALYAAQKVLDRMKGGKDSAFPEKETDHGTGA